MAEVILVTGATGRQGGATARHLLARSGWGVRVLVRDPDAEAARQLADLGAEVVRGDMADPGSLDAAMRGAYGVFSVQPTFVSAERTPQLRPEDEPRWARAVADAAHRAGVRHYVYASAIGAERETGIRNVDLKGEIERYLAELGLPTTILRPVSFMENYASPARLADGTIATAIGPDSPEQLIAAHDIGAFAALAFDHPREYIGRALDIAGDELTLPEIADAVSRAFGRPVRYVQIPLDTLAARDENLARAFKRMNDGGFRTATSIAELRDLHPDLMTFADWLAGEGTAKVRAGLAAS